MRLILAPLLALTLVGAGAPETHIVVTLSPDVAKDASGRLLIFAAPATAANSHADAVDIGGSDQKGVSVAARDVGGFGAGRSVIIDTHKLAFPKGFETLAPGEYRLQAVLDRDGSYNYGGRGPGDIVSKVVSVTFPLTSTPSIALDQVVPPEAGQFDTTGIPPRAAAQIAASRPHLHDEHIESRSLTRFFGTKQSIAAWVLTPPGYDPAERKTYPTVYMAGGFGATHKLDGQQLSQIWHLMEIGAIPPMIWVALDFSSSNGTTEFVDSANNGPWGQALVGEVMPTIERRYRMDARPSGRFLTGHSSGGWFALWEIVRYPAMFGGSWPTSPDPIDFRDFLGVDIYGPGANMYHDAKGALRPLQRDDGKVLMTIKQAVQLEGVLGHKGGQFRSFDWTFSPRRADGQPAYMFDRKTGAVDPAVAAYWRAHYDIGHRVEINWQNLKPELDGKIHITVGDVDSYYLDGAVHRFQDVFRKIGGHADFTFVPNASHAMAQVYAQGGDRTALWKEMSRAMYAVARPEGDSGRERQTTLKP